MHKNKINYAQLINTSSYCHINKNKLNDFELKFVVKTEFYKTLQI